MTDTFERLLAIARAWIPGLAGLTLMAAAIREYPHSTTLAIAFSASAMVAFVVVLVAREQTRRSADLVAHLAQAERAAQAQERFLRLIEANPIEPAD